MKFIKIEPQLIKEREVIDKVVCDICNIDMSNRESYEQSEVNINAKLGCNYPEGDCRTGYVIDVCPTCFIEKSNRLLKIHLIFNLERLIQKLWVMIIFK